LKLSHKPTRLPPLGLFKRQAGPLSLRIQAARHPKTRDLYVDMLASPSLRSDAQRSGLTDLPRPNIRGLPTAQPERRSGDRAKNR
jgi:hypothetical protein